MTTITTTLVIGATGATGRHVVQTLLDRGQEGRVIARSKERTENLLNGDFADRLEISEASILDLNQFNAYAMFRIVRRWEVNEGQRR